MCAVIWSTRVWFVAMHSQLLYRLDSSNSKQRRKNNCLDIPIKLKPSICKAPTVISETKCPRKSSVSSSKKRSYELNFPLALGWTMFLPRSQGTMFYTSDANWLRAVQGRALIAERPLDRDRALIWFRFEILHLDVTQYLIRHFFSRNVNKGLW